MILVTGCAGFIGSHLCESLLRDNQNVLGIDNFDSYYDISFKKFNLEILKKYINFRFFKVDITDKNAVDRLFFQNTFTSIIHLAARPGVAPSITNPFPYYKNNIEGTINLLNEIIKNKTPFVFISSSSIYGGSKKIPFCEKDMMEIPLSPYGISKLTAENYCYYYHKLYRIPLTILRLFTVYGPRVRPDMAIVKFIKSIDEERELTLYNQGKIERDFTYIDDIVNGIRQAIEKKYDFEIINLGGNRPIKLNHVINLLEKSIGKKARTKFSSLPEGEMEKTWADTEKAKKLLSWVSQVSFEDGVKETVKWYLRESRK